jgi:hypothetical protein
MVLQADLARRIPGGHLLSAAHSGHSVQQGEPEVVVNAVHKVVQVARQ